MKLLELGTPGSRPLGAQGRCRGCGSRRREARFPRGPLPARACWALSTPAGPTAWGSALQAWRLRPQVFQLMKQRHAHTLTHIHTCSHTPIHSHTCSLTHIDTLSLIHTTHSHTCTRILTHIHTSSHIFTLSHSFTHPQTRAAPLQEWIHCFRTGLKRR